MLAPSQTLLTERRPLAALCDIVEPWRRLAAHAAEPNVFYEPGFALAAAPVLGREVEAILVWSADMPRRLVGLFPFRVAARRYGVKLPVLEGWTHPFAPLGTPLVDRDATAAVVPSFLDHVATNAMLPKLLLLPLLNDSGPGAQALRAAVERGGLGDVRPASARGFAAGRRRHALRRTRHRKKAPQGIPTSAPPPRRSRAGRIRGGAEPGRCGGGAAGFPRTRMKGWKGAAGTALTQAPKLRRFAETAVDALARQGQAGVARLLLGSRPIACIVTLHSAGGAWCWKIAYDESLARFSPGVQAMMELTEALLADDTVEFADSARRRTIP